MLVFLSMLAAAVLLFSIIVFLHRLQYREKVESVDRTSPLPPLTGTDKLRVLSIESSPNTDFQGELTVFPRAAPWLSEILGSESMDTATAKDWQTQCRIHAAAHDHERALMWCARAFPQMGAFRQAATLLRGRMRELRKDGRPWEEELERLYRVAAWADLLHGKWEGNPALSMGQLKRVDMLSHQDLPIDYSRLGYQKLTLLGTTDCKLLAERHGEPSSHFHARELYGEALQALLNTQKYH